MSQFRLHQTLVALAGMVFLAGCESAPVYMPPAEGATATLLYPKQFKKFGLPSVAFGPVQIAPKGNDGCGSLTVLPKVPGEEESSTRLRGGRDYFLLMAEARGTYSCLVYFSFHAEENANYRLRFDYGASTCRGTVSMLIGDQELPVPLKAVKLGPERGKICEK